MSSKVWPPIRRLLAVRMDNIGDVIMLGPALRSLHAAFPGVEISLLSSPAGALAAELLPWVKEVIPWRAIWQDVSGQLEFNPQREMDLIEDLRSRQFDAAWIFTSFSQSPFPPAYAAYLAGIPIRVGHSKEFGGQVLSHAYPAPPDSGHQVDRNLSLVEHAGLVVLGQHLELKVSQAAQQSADALLHTFGLGPQAPFIAAAPGASCSARRYPPQRFAQGIAQAAAQTGLPVVILGSQREAETLAPVLDQVDGRRMISLVGKTSVPELAGVIRRSALVLANNSASLHLADAFNRPMVILYSGTEYESQWKPRSGSSQLLRVPTDCSPCFQFTCPFELQCLDISPDTVVQALVDLLEQSQSGAALERISEAQGSIEEKQLTGRKYS